MIRVYLRERGAWISFFIILLAFTNLLFYLDIGLSGVSVGYFNVIVISLFMLFLIWRYKKETRQLKNFLGNIFENNIKDTPTETLSPFQQEYIEALSLKLDEKEQQYVTTKFMVQENAENTLAWIHEMKTPLTAMKLMVEQIDNTKVRQKVEMEWFRINFLLDQQLHNTRLATIEKDNRFETFNLQEVVNKEIRDFRSWCMEKGIGFQIDGLDQQVITDRKWLSFIIRQILSNSIKYSYANSEIQFYTEVDIDDHLLLYIVDNGVGIESGDLPRIFQKSFTGTVGRESFQSTGMGLYLADNAANKLGIKILVKSKVHHGTTIILKFPNKNEYQEILGR